MNVCLSLVSIYNIFRGQRWRPLDLLGQRDRAPQVSYELAMLVVLEVVESLGSVNPPFQLLRLLHTSILLLVLQIQSYLWHNLLDFAALFNPVTEGFLILDQF